jgi:hypothetical protein
VLRRVRLVAWTAAALAICAALILLARRAADAPATSDTAVIESYTLLAAEGRLLVGAYSRFQWHHPGPLYFYLLAPFYAGSGSRTAGLSAGAAAISIASLAVIALILSRRRITLAIATCGLIALLAWRASEALASPWNPHVPLLPAVALVVAAADVVAGAAAMLPIVALLASLCGQAHVALLPFALVIGIVPAAVAIVSATRQPSPHRWRRSLAATALTLSAAWCLPLYEQITATPRGNITELWRFVTAHAQAGQPFGVAVSAWSDMMAGVLRPDFSVAHGWPFVESPVRWAEWLTLAVLTALAVLTFRGARGRRTFETALGMLVIAGAAVALWSATRISERIFDHDVFWVAGLGALALAMAADLVAEVTARRVAVPPTAGAALCLGLVLLASLAIVRGLNDTVAASFTPPAEAASARDIASDLLAYIDREQVLRPVIRIDQDAWGVAAGAILELQKQGRAVSVEEDWVVMFTPAFRATGAEQAVVTIAMPAEHLRLEDRRAALISAHHPFYAHLERVNAAP